MFTGIIENRGVVASLQKDQSNLNITVRSTLAQELKIDQSLAHNGVCLTVVAISGNTYTVTAIDETLKRSNLGHLKVGDHVNLERALALGSRLDGHMVQGHVDGLGHCTQIDSQNGSWVFSLRIRARPAARYHRERVDHR